MRLSSMILSIREQQRENVTLRDSRHSRLAGRPWPASQRSRHARRRFRQNPRSTVLPSESAAGIFFPCSRACSAASACPPPYTLIAAASFSAMTTTGASRKNSLAEFAVSFIAVRSPQAKGRVDGRVALYSGDTRLEHTNYPGGRHFYVAITPNLEKWPASRGCDVNPFSFVRAFGCPTSEALALT